MTQLAMSFNGTEMDTAISSVKTSVGDVETKVDDNVEEIKYGAYVFYFCFVSNMLLGTFSFLCSSNFACCGYWSMVYLNYTPLLHPYKPNSATAI